MSWHCAQWHVATRPRPLRVHPRTQAPTALPPLHCVDPVPTHTPPHQRAARPQWLNHKYTHYLTFHLFTSGIIHVTKHTYRSHHYSQRHVAKHPWHNKAGSSMIWVQFRLYLLHIAVFNCLHQPTLPAV